MEKYKQTDIGVIPSDWEVKTIGSESTSFSGGTPDTANRSYYGGEINFLVSGDLNKIRISSVEGRITKEGYENSSAKMVSTDTLLIAMYGATAGVCAITAIEASINQAVLAIVTNEVVCNKYYLFHWWQFNKDNIVTTLTQGGQPNLSGNVIKQVYFPLPTIYEQTAIATALSDADSYITHLEKLIAKKRLIKQGAMQELLRPKEWWVVRRLGDVFEISGGYSATRDQLSDDGYCYLHYGDIHGSTKTFIDTNADFTQIPKLKIDIGKFSKKSLLQNGDVVFVDASEDDEGVSRHLVILNEGGVPFISGLHTIVARSKESSMDNLYKRYCFQTKFIKDQFKFYAVGTKVSGVSKSTIRNINIYLPTLKEQIFIGSILNDMDTDIATIEKQLAKAKSIKQGMMQQLLTGKIRLIPET
jgi:type I restriction enzyme S subunit